MIINEFITHVLIGQVIGIIWLVLLRARSRRRRRNRNEKTVE